MFGCLSAAAWAQERPAEFRLMLNERSVSGTNGYRTVIIGPDGVVRYVIRKRVTNEERAQRQKQYIAGAGGKYWMQSGGASAPVEIAFRQLHGRTPGVTPRRRTRRITETK